MQVRTCSQGKECKYMLTETDHEHIQQGVDQGKECLLEAKNPDNIELNLA